MLPRIEFNHLSRIISAHQEYRTALKEHCQSPITCMMARESELFLLCPRCENVRKWATILISHLDQALKWRGQ